MRISLSFPHRSGAFLALSIAAVLAIAACPSARADEADGADAISADAPPAPPPAPPPDPCRPCWCDPPPAGCPCPKTCIPDTLIHIPCLDGCIESFEKAKADSCFKLSAGAYHWFNYNFDTKKLNYGSPSAQGTYFYWIDGDLECKTCNPCVTWGAHVELRARDQSTFRTFFDHEVWLYEAYAFLNFADYGKFKVGKVWKRFGLDWDGTFYGNVAYFDGFKLDPDYGVTWEKTWNAKGRFQVDAFAQWFWHEDGVNGSIAGADPESTHDFTEKSTFVGRVVPTWHFRDNLSLAVGASAYTGTVANNLTGSDDTATGWAADATLTWCDFKAFGEYMQSDGTLNGAHYVTGGPSDSRTDWLVGAQYKLGAFTPRVVYSHGDYANPGGSQDLWVVGGTIELTKYVTLYLEYVRWDVAPDAGAKVKYENGLEFVIAWHV